jgi:hypothetical protein
MLASRRIDDLILDFLTKVGWIRAVRIMADNEFLAT